jgi:hypothetical protein
MRYFLSVCVALLYASNYSQAQAKAPTTTVGTNEGGPTYGIYTHVQTQEPYLAMTFDDGLLAAEKRKRSRQ